MEAANPEPVESENSGQRAKIAFARRLASPDSKTREKAISLLTVWLTSQDSVDEQDLKKIWKGLFYCVWHADKVPVQADLIDRLASILEKLEVELAFHFFSIFLFTMRREWAGIDRLRLDKFYLLLRKFLVHMFMVLENQEWDRNWTKKFMNALEERTFLVKDQYAAQGINFHYADVFITELQKFAPLKQETFTLVFEGYCNMLGKICDKLLLKRLMESIFTPLLERGHVAIKVMQEGGKIDVCAENIGFLVLTSPLTSVIFQLASLPSTPQPNRKVLYELHSEFCKLEKALALSGVTLPASIFKKDGNKRKEKPSGDQSENLQGNLELATASSMLEDMKFSAKKRKGSSKKLKSGDKLAINSKKCQNIPKRGCINAIIGEANENSPPNQERVLHDSNLDMPKTGLTSAVIQDTDENLLSSHEKIPGDDGFEVHDPVISNLRKRFDLIATKGLDDLDTSDRLMVSSQVPLLKRKGSKKRKRQKAENSPFSGNSRSEQENDTSPCSPLSGTDSTNNTLHKKKKARFSNGILPCTSVLSDSGLVNNFQLKEKTNSQENGVSACSPLSTGFDSASNTSEKKKKVRFALKNNLVWKPFFPLPPQILRVPPSATPRGSALKKGVPPGPIVTVKEAASKPKKRNIGRPSAQRNFKRLRKSASGLKNFVSSTDSFLHANSLHMAPYSTIFAGSLSSI